MAKDKTPAPTPPPNEENNPVPRIELGSLSNAYALPAHDPVKVRRLRECWRELDGALRNVNCGLLVDLRRFDFKRAFEDLLGTE